jgi:hypothetical protein
MKGHSRFGGQLKTKRVHGVETGNHSNPHVLRSARAHGGACLNEVEGGSGRPRLDHPGRKMGGRICKADGGATAPRDEETGDTDNAYAKGGWIKGAVKHPGALRKSLHVKEGEPIPAKKLAKAEHSSNPILRKRAVLAETFKGFHKKD